MSSPDLSRKLDRFASLLSASGQSLSASTETTQLPCNRSQQLARELGGRAVATESGSVCLFEKLEPYRSLYGAFSLEESYLQTQQPMAAFSGKQSEQLVAGADLIFFDTETTGLGGSGAVAFLAGSARFTEGGLLVRQFVMPDYSDEAALLLLFAAECTDQSVLVSYNGGAFDLPLLESRLVINRLGRKLPHRLHLDLLHCSRRLFRRRLRDCSLGNIEREIFGHNRIGDIPGYLVPAAYFTWLSDSNSEPLQAVLSHHRQDIVSLALLYQLLDQIYRGEGELLSRSDDLYSLGRLYGRHRSHQKAVRAIDRIAAVDGTTSVEEIALFRAFSLKRNGDAVSAALIWRELSAREDRTGLIALIELSKWQEHANRDHAAALEFALQAVARSAALGLTGAELERRVSRLEKRTNSLS